MWLYSLGAPGVFLICWLPFFVTHILNTHCRTCYIPPALYSAFTWLGYVNSALNPIIYTTFNIEFRRAFIKILTCWGRTGDLNGNEAVHSCCISTPVHLVNCDHRVDPGHRQDKHIRSPPCREIYSDGDLKRGNELPQQCAINAKTNQKNKFCFQTGLGHHLNSIIPDLKLFIILPFSHT